MNAKKAGVRELKTNLSDYLRRVEEGEIITITRRGKPIGKIIPESTPLEEKMDALIRSGFLHWGKKKLSPWNPIIVNKEPGLVSDLVSEERDVDHIR